MLASLQAIFWVVHKLRHSKKLKNDFSDSVSNYHSALNQTDDILWLTSFINDPQNVFLWKALQKDQFSIEMKSNLQNCI
jgi:hypothetical protein